MGASVGRLAKGGSPGVLEEAGRGGRAGDGKHELCADEDRRTTASGGMSTGVRGMGGRWQRGGPGDVDTCPDIKRLVYSLLHKL